MAKHKIEQKGRKHIVSEHINGHWQPLFTENSRAEAVLALQKYVDTPIAPKVAPKPASAAPKPKVKRKRKK